MKKQNYIVEQVMGDELEIVIQNNGVYRLQTKYNANIIVWISELMDVYTREAHKIFNEQKFGCQLGEEGRKIYSEDINKIYEIKKWIESLILAKKLKGECYD